MIRAARENTGGLMRYANLDAQAIPFPTGYFDAVLANHMLYHIPDQPRAVAEIRRVLKPGGRLFAATNGVTNMTGLDELVERLAPDFAPRSNPQVERWRRAFTLENGRAILGQCFQTVRIECYPDDLIITESQPVIDYILSMQANFERDVSNTQITAFRAALEEELRIHGSIFVHKDVGLFIAS
jgi:SAM-dependent methyltransferase